jgi:hypothetical protein
MYGTLSMEKELAWHLIRATFRSTAELQALIPLLKEHCGEKEYKIYGRALARAIDKINVELANRIFSSHPELKAEVESKISKYGRVIPRA